MSGAIAGLGALSASRRAPAAAPRPGLKTRVAIVGIRGRGKSLAQGFSRQSDCEITALCDVDQSTFSPALAEVKKHQDSVPRMATDFREILDDKSIDAVVFATPDHWHALQTILACQAGKDVYVEKPLAHNLREGQAMVHAARKYDRVVQMGTQRRSQKMMSEACDFVRGRKLGHVAMARCWTTSTRPNIGKVADSAVPDGVDWNLWLGPAPERPFNKNRFHYHWRWFWDTGTGEIGNNGVHFLDIARWALGVESPIRITSCGGQLVHKDDRETPDTQITTFEFPGDKILIWEHRIWSKRGIDGLPSGMEFYGDRGTVLLKDQVWKVVDAGNLNAEHRGGSGWLDHIRNFLDCIQTRDKPNADVEIGYRSTALSLLGNLAHQKRASIDWDGHDASIAGRKLDDIDLARTYRHGFELPGGV